METIEFAIHNHTNRVDGEHAVMDAVARIVTQLNELELKYEDDWKLDSSYYSREGHKILAIVFYNASDAMLARIKGLA